jgi:hypothetical protein
LKDGNASGNGVEQSLTILHFFTIFLFLLAGLCGAFLIFIAEKKLPPK